MRTIRYLIYGRVQGVAYRAFTRNKANKLGVSGWVKNKANGSVECIAVADSEILALFESALKKGPCWSRIDRVEKFELEQDGNLSGFEVRH